MNWDFGGDEWVFFIASAAIVLFGTARYYFPLISVSLIRKSFLRRILLASLPPISIVPTYVVLCRWTDPQVLGHLDYTILFMLGATAFIFVTASAIQILGISIRQDAIERDNPAALAAICGILPAVGIIYALSNIGTGPTIWTTIIPALAAALSLALASLLIELIGGHVAEAITVDRDLSTGIRLAASLLGCAFILGRAAAGNWVSWTKTLIDFASHGWPAILIVIAAAATHRKLRPTAARPQPDILLFGLIPAASFVSVGFILAAIGTRTIHPNQW
jgi:hypothetical protein